MTSASRRNGREAQTTPISRLDSDRVSLLPRRGAPARSALMLAGGVTVGQLVTLAAAPILTRLYAPGAFGALAAFSAIVSIVVAVASLRYEMAIPIAKDAVGGTRLLALALVLVAFAAVLTAVVWVVLGDLVSTAIGVPALGPLGWAVAVAVLAAGSYQSLMLWHVRQRSYRAIATTRMTQAVAGTVTQVGLGATGLGAGGLLIGDVVGRSVGLGTLLRPAWTSVRTAGISLRSLSTTAAAHRRFAAWLSSASLLSTAALHAPYLLLPASFGPSPAGMYFLSHRILLLPVALVGGSVGQVFFGDAAEARRDPDRLRQLATGVALALFAVGWPIYGGVVIAGEPLFTFVFGSEWSDAGGFARLLAPSFLLWSVASPLSSMLVVSRREVESFVFTGMELAARVGSILLGVTAGSVQWAVLFLAVSGVVLHLASIWRFLRPTGVRPATLLRPAAGVAALNVPGLAVLGLVSSVQPGWWTVVTFMAVVGLGIAGAAIAIPRIRHLVRGS